MNTNNKHTRTHTHAHTHTYTHTYTRTYTLTHTHARIHMHTHAHTRTHMYTHAHTRTHTHTRVHTHTHRSAMSYLTSASSSLTPDSLHQRSCDIDRLRAEFLEIPPNHPAENNFLIPGHGTKNRYRTILPSKLDVCGRQSVVFVVLHFIYFV